MENISQTISGLSDAEALKRLKQYGSNEMAKRKKLSGLADFLLRFKNPLIFILLVAAVISASFGDWTSSIIIVVIVLISVVLDFVNTYKSQKAAEALKERVRITATLIRDGKTQEIPLANIVPGDIVLLTPGDLIPADGKIIQARDFFINESSLTGESFPAEKMMADKIFMGSSAVTGNATMEVTLTGQATKFGKIAESLIKKEEPTEFDKSIKDFSYLIMRITFALVIFVFFINAFFKRDLFDSFLFSAALAVGLTPELLPMIIAINLSKGSIIMAKHGVIVKRLSAIQNFGSMDILCTDKTGTLTEDKITLVKYVDGFGQKSEDVLSYAYISSSYHSGFKSPLETAIKEFQNIDISTYKKVDEIPFDYSRRRGSIVVEYQGKRILITKGAPEEILKVCEFYEKTGNPFQKNLLDSSINQYQSLSRDGFRVLGVAIKYISEIKEVYSKEEENKMTFIGFTAFLDPAKKTVAETLQSLKKHGVEIKILTGDNELVTQKIAHDINLPIKGIILGSEMEEMNDTALRIKAEETTIFARVSPDQKTRIIRALRANNHVVGYMGDGINDAPSLKAADVGVSVNNAVDVAKESADLILLKKSLTDLMNGVIEGRKTFSNTLKYLMMDLSSNFGNMFSMAGASIFMPFLPMLPAQILLNNLLYDGSQFAIPMDNVDKEDVQKPQKMNMSFIKKFMIIFGPVSSLFDLITFIVLFLIFKLQATGFQTGWFIESLATQTFVVYIIRTRKLPFFKSLPNKYLTISTISIVTIGWIIALSSMGYIFNFTPLPIPVILSIAAIVTSYLIVVEIIKGWFYKKYSLELNK